MQNSSKLILALTLAAASLAPSASFAKDWLESVQLTKDGIDVVPIEVTTNGSTYTEVKSGSHRFLFGLYARATNGERIVAAALSTKSASYFESLDAGEWRKRFTGRNVGNGTKRTWSMSYAPQIPLSKVTWVGGTPVDKCNALLAQKRSNGTSRVAVLNQKQTTTALASFSLQAVAARKNKAKNNTWNIGNTDTENRNYSYQVQVSCLPNTMGGIQSN